MTVKELITALLEMPMDNEVKLQIEKDHIDEYGEKCSGWLFCIDEIEKDGYLACINFTDWRDVPDNNVGEMDCISRQAVIDAIKKFASMIWKEYRAAFPESTIMEMIQALPPVKPEQKIGWWIKSEIPNEEYVCSECGGACWYYDVGKEVTKSRFCPNCGVKMDVPDTNVGDKSESEDKDADSD